MGPGLTLAVCAAASAGAESADESNAGADAGAVAVCIARSWADVGHDVLLVDGDAHGGRLSARLGTATRTALHPDRRGLPSLMADRSTLSLSVLAQHCWQMPVAGTGSLWLLLAPTHPDGAHRSARWLSERADAFAAVSRRRAVVTALPGHIAEPYGALARAAQQRVVLSAEDHNHPDELRSTLTELGLDPSIDSATVLSLAQPVPPTRDDVDGTTAPAETLPRPVHIGPVRERALLGGRSRRSDRPALQALNALAHDLASAWSPSADQPVDDANRNGRPPAHAEATATTGSNAPHAATAGVRP